VKESELVSFCLQYLTTRRIFHWRNNTGAFGGTYTRKGDGQTVKRFLRFGAPGSPDIFALIKGRFIGIECKVGDNKQSPDQLAFQKDLERNGGIYWLIYSPEQLVSKLI
jgi:hypothetical protein